MANEQRGGSGNFANDPEKEDYELAQCIHAALQWSAFRGRCCLERLRHIGKCGLCTSASTSFMFRKRKRLMTAPYAVIGPI